MQRRLHNKIHLEQFGGRLAKARPLNLFQCSCLKIASEAYSLWQQYPNAFLFRNAAKFEFDAPNEDEDYDDGQDVIYMDEYIHFVADSEGGLYNALSEMVNCSFQERQFTQEPTLQTLYVRTPVKTENLDFERRLIELINNLCGLLNELP